MGLYVYAGARGIGIILFFAFYAAVISGHVFTSGWALVACAFLGAIFGFAVSLLSWDQWVDDYWYSTYGEDFR